MRRGTCLGSEKNTQRDMFREIKGKFHEKSQREKLKKYESKVQPGAMDRNATQGRGEYNKEERFV